jgi:hypothetical protein
VEREPRAPLDVGHEGGAELGVVRQHRVIRGQAHQGGEAQALLRGDRQVLVLADHAVVATQLLRVLGGTAEDLGPPEDHVVAMLAADAVGKERRDQLVPLDAVVERIDQALERLLSARPLMERRGIARFGHPMKLAT